MPRVGPVDPDNNNPIPPPSVHRGKAEPSPVTQKKDVTRKLPPAVASKRGPVVSESPISMESSPEDVGRFLKSHVEKATAISSDIKTMIKGLEDSPENVDSFFDFARKNFEPGTINNVFEAIKNGSLDPAKIKKKVEYLKQQRNMVTALKGVPDSFFVISATVITIFGDRALLPFGLGSGAYVKGYKEVTGEKLEAKFLDVTGKAVDIFKIVKLFHDVPQEIMQGGLLGMHSYILHCVGKEVGELKSKLRKVENENDVEGAKALRSEIEKLEQWLKVQSKANRDSWLAYGVKVGAAIPSRIKTLGKFASMIILLGEGFGISEANVLFEAGEKGFEFTLDVANILSFATYICIVITKGFAFYRTRKNWLMVQGWMSDVKKREYSDYYRLEYDKYVNETLQSDPKAIKREFSRVLGVPLEDFVPTGRAIKDEVVSLFTGTRPLESKDDIIELLANKEINEAIFKRYKAKRISHAVDSDRKKFIQTLREEVFNTEDLVAAKIKFRKKFNIDLEKLRFVGTLNTPADYLNQFEQNPQLYHQVLVRDFRAKANVDMLLKKRQAINTQRMEKTKTAFDGLLEDFIDVNDPSLDVWKKKGLFFDRVCIKQGWITPQKLMANLSKPSRARWRNQYFAAKHKAAIDGERKRLNLFVERLNENKIAVPKQIRFANLDQIQEKIAPKDREAFREVLENSLDNFIQEKKVELENEFTEVLKGTEAVSSLDASVGVLWRNGIPIEDFTLADIQQSARLEILGVSDARDKLQVQYVRHEEAMTASTKMAMRALENRKISAEKSFWKMDVWLAGIAFGVTLVTVVVVFVICLAAGIALSSTAPYVMFGFIIFGLALVLCGYLFLLWKKPNMARPITYIRKAYIAFVKIPHAIQSFRLIFNLMNRARITARSDVLKARKLEEIFTLATFDPDSETMRKKFPDLRSVEDAKKRAQSIAEEISKTSKVRDDTLKKIDEKIEALEKKVAYWEGIFKPVQQKIAHMGWEDFAKPLNLDPDVDYPEAIADAILYGKDFPDPELERILKKDLGVDPQTIKKMVDKRCENDREKRHKIVEEIKSKVEGFFGGLADELLGVAKRPEPNLEARTAYMAAKLSEAR